MIRTSTSIGVALAVAAALLAVTIAIRPVAPRVWIGGMVQWGSMATTEDGGTFTLVANWGDGPDTVVVEHGGELPPTVCDRRGVRVDVAIEGHLDGDRFIADTVEGYNNGRYDPCWEWRCVALELHPQDCGRGEDLRFE